MAVTSARKTSYEIRHVFYQDANILDAIVWLGAYRADRAAHAVRLLTVQLGDRSYSYITNVLDPTQLTALDMVRLYGRRWDIERAINLVKTHLQLHLWWSAKTTVILQQLWAVLPCEPTSPRRAEKLNFEGVASFEQLPYFFQSGFYKTTPTTDASSAKIWRWDIQNASTDPIATTDLQTYTLEFGDNQQAEYMNYCFTREFNLSGTVGEALNVPATMEGRTVATTDFTSGINIPTVESILFTNAKLYIDPSSDTIGTTQVSQTIFAVDLNCTTGWRGYPAADGRTDFSFVKRTKEEITCSITFEHNATAVAEKAAWRNQTERAIRINFTGNALSSTDAGATYDVKTFIVDMYGKWESFDALTDQDGNDQVTGLFRVGYSSAAAARTAGCRLPQTPRSSEKRSDRASSSTMYPVRAMRPSLRPAGCQGQRTLGRPRWL